MSYKDPQKWMDDALPVVIGFVLLMALMAMFAPLAHAETYYSDVQVCRAIYDAEGGSKATYLYGIRSVHYKDVAEARHICLRTVKHARKDFKALKIKEPFIGWLSKRYCPVGASNDPHGLNKNWTKNVLYFLKRNI